MYPRQGEGEGGAEGDEGEVGKGDSGSEGVSALRRGIIRAPEVTYVCWPSLHTLIVLINPDNVNRTSHTHAHASYLPSEGGGREGRCAGRVIGAPGGVGVRGGGVWGVLGGWGVLEVAEEEA